jgi:DNA gyrase subunit A
VAGRNTQGVKLVNLDNNDLVMAVARVIPEDEGDGTDTGDGGEDDSEGGEEGEE